MLALLSWLAVASTTPTARAADLSAGFVAVDDTTTNLRQTNDSLRNEIRPLAAASEFGDKFAAVTAAAQSSSFRSTVDATISADSPQSNYGGDDELTVDGSPRHRVLLRFNVSGLPSDAVIQAAQLRLYTLDNSSAAGAVREVAGDWSEGNVTWANAPDTGSTISAIGAVSSGSWATVDVTAAVDGNETVDLYLTSEIENGAEFASSESGRPPELVLHWDTGTTSGGLTGGSATPVPQPPSSTSGDCRSIPSDRLNLLSERQGFGRSTSGGASGCLYIVTNNNDSGPGSLRWAAERGGFWITFDRDMTITLSDQIEVAGNTTIDGRGRRIVIERGGLYMDRTNSANVILTHLTIRNGRTGEDLIQIRNGAMLFWLNHLTLTNSGDEYIDIGNAWGGEIRGTISWSRFDREPGNEHEFATLIGDGYGADTNRDIYLTLHHNWYNGTHQRNPMINGARVHMYNNLIQWRLWGTSIKHTGTSTPAQLVSENNIYDARYAEKDRQITAIHQFDSGNYIRVDGELEMSGAIVKDNNPSRAFRPRDFYGYSLETANSSLFSRVTGGAGAQ